MKPSDQITSALTGALKLSEISDASRSALSFQIYKIARDVLAESKNEKRKQIIETYPAEIQNLLRTECRRIYEMRK